MTAKIKFQDFLASYVVDPTKFSLYNDCVYVRAPDGLHHTRFGPFGKIIYKMWVWDLFRRRQSEKDAEMAAILCAMKDAHRYDDTDLM